MSTIYWNNDTAHGEWYYPPWEPQTTTTVYCDYSWSNYQLLTECVKLLKEILDEMKKRRKKKK